MGVVHFLLSHQAGLGFCNAVQSVVLKVQHVTRRLHAIELVFRERYMVLCVLDGRIVLRQLQLQLGDLQHRHHLSRLHARPIVDVEGLHKP